MKADGRFIERRLNMNAKITPEEAKSQNDRLMNIVKNKIAIKKIKS